MRESCRHFGICGGCDFQDLYYEDQLKAKETRLKDLFSQFKIKEIAKIIPSPEIFYYRNKMEYAVGGTSSSPSVGLREKKRFYKIVDLEECKIFSGFVRDIFGIFKNWIKDCGIEPYQQRRHTGDIRYVALRHSKHYDELMIIIVLTSKGCKLDLLLSKLKNIKNVKSIYLCVNEKKADVAVTEELILAWGEPYIREKVNTVDYLISPDSFFQTNSYCCNELYSAIRNETRNMKGKALDICCGSGGITLQVAPSFDTVIGVDMSARNIEAARENARLNNIKNTDFIREDAEKFLLACVGSKSIKDLSTIILDPPRAGLSKKTKTTIINSGVKNIIYISCNPVNLAEDLKVIAGSYEIVKVIPVDMFPHTRHVEVIAILRANEV